MPHGVLEAGAVAELQGALVARVGERVAVAHTAMDKQTQQGWVCVQRTWGVSTFRVSGFVPAHMARWTTKGMHI